MIFNSHRSAEPVRVQAFDDWTRATTSTTAHEQQLSLNFAITGRKIFLSAGILLISRALEMQQKIETLINDQRTGALRYSKAYSASQSSNAARPNVATAMITQARSRVKEHHNLSYVVVQNMRLQLDSLIVNIFPNSLHDNLAMSAEGGHLFAHLRRIVAAEDQPLHRDLYLAFNELKVSKLGNMPTDVPGMLGTSVGSANWMAYAAGRSKKEQILTIPALRARMNSDETDGPADGPLRILKARFKSQFDRNTMSKEDIYVSLNYTLFSDLNELKSKAVEIIARSRRDAATSNAAVAAAARKTAKLQEEDVARAAATLGPSASPTLASQRPAISQRTASFSGTMPSTSPMPAAAAAPRPLLGYNIMTTDIQRPMIEQMGETTPALKSNFVGVLKWDLEEPIPKRCHEFGTIPLEQLMKTLLDLYSKQLKLSDVAAVEVDGGGTPVGEAAHDVFPDFFA